MHNFMCYWVDLNNFIQRNLCRLIAFIFYPFRLIILLLATLFNLPSLMKDVHVPWSNIEQVKKSFDDAGDKLKLEETNHLITDITQKKLDNFFKSGAFSYSNKDELIFNELSKPNGYYDRFLSYIYSARQYHGMSPRNSVKNSSFLTVKEQALKAEGKADKLLTYLVGAPLGLLLVIMYYGGYWIGALLTFIFINPISALLNTITGASAAMVFSFRVQFGFGIHTTKGGSAADTEYDYHEVAKLGYRMFGDLHPGSYVEAYSWFLWLLWFPMALVVTFYVYRFFYLWLEKKLYMVPQGFLVLLNTCTISWSLYFCFYLVYFANVCLYRSGFLVS